MQTYTQQLVLVQVEKDFSEQFLPNRNKNHSRQYEAFDLRPACKCAEFGKHIRLNSELICIDSIILMGGSVRHEEGENVLLFIVQAAAAWYGGFGKGIC